MITISIKTLEKRFGYKIKRNVFILGVDTATCFDDQTEIFTDKGWKLFKDLNKDEQVLTRNNEGGIEFQKPLRYIEHDYCGKMYHIKNKNFDSVATPDHSYYYKSGYDSRYKQSKLVNKKIIIPITGKWKGINKKTYTIAQTGKDGYTKQKRYVNMKKWVSFLGWFISEGNTFSDSRGNYGVSINQKKKENRIIIQQLIEDLNFKYCKNNTVFKIQGKQIYEWCKKYCYNGKEIKRKSVYNCYNKKVPDFIKELSPELIQCFLDSFILGDGNYNKKTNSTALYTSSNNLKNDLTELLLKVGKGVNITKRKDSCTILEGRKIVNKHDNFIIHQLNSKERCLKKNNIEVIDYNGKVYCVEVPNHIIYVRRKKCGFWCGNCSGICRMWIDDTNVRIKTEVLKLDVNAKEVDATDEKGEKLEIKMNAFHLMAKELAKSIKYNEGNILVLENSYSGINVWTYGILRIFAGIFYTNLYDKFDNVKLIFPTSARKMVGFKSSLPKGTKSKDKKKEIMIWISNIVKEDIKEDNEADALLLCLAGAKEE